MLWVILMKLIILILTFCFCSIGYAQLDTLRTFYPNGQLKSEYPRLNKEYNGLGRQWYDNGQLWISGNWINGALTSIAYNYFKDGSIQMKSWYDKGKIIKIKSYHENGKRSLFETHSKNILRIKYWYANGNLKSKAKHKNGQPISCIEPFYEDNRTIKKEDTYCYEGDKQVFWKDSLYVDSLGIPIHRNYKYSLCEFYETGKIKTKTKYRNGFTYRKEWDEQGNLIKKEEE